SAADPDSHAHSHANSETYTNSEVAPDTTSAPVALSMKRKHAVQFALFNLCVAVICAVCATVYANTITVTNTNDSGPGSLRQALVDANGGDTITFAVTGTIGLTSAELVIDKPITVSGPGADVLADACISNALIRVVQTST